MLAYKGALVAQVEGPGGWRQSYEYDANGNLIRETDANGNATEYAYTASDQLAAIRGAGSHEASLTYNEQNQLVSRTNPFGSITHYRYHPTGELAATQSPSGATTQYDYNGVSRVMEKTDTAGETTRYIYDELDRLAEMIERYTPVAMSGVLAQSPGRTHDAKGRLDGQSRSGHDFIFNQLLIANDEPINLTTRYTYDLVGNLLSVTNPQGETTRYTHDALDRVTTMQSGQGPILNVTYRTAPVDPLWSGLEAYLPSMQATEPCQNVDGPMWNICNDAVGEINAIYWHSTEEDWEVFEKATGYKNYNEFWQDMSARADEISADSMTQSLLSMLFAYYLLNGQEQEATDTLLLISELQGLQVDLDDIDLGLPTGAVDDCEPSSFEPQPGQASMRLTTLLELLGLIDSEGNLRPGAESVEYAIPLNFFLQVVVGANGAIRFDGGDGGYIYNPDGDRIVLDETPIVVEVAEDGTLTVSVMEVVMNEDGTYRVTTQPARIITGIAPPSAGVERSDTITIVLDEGAEIDLEASTSVRVEVTDNGQVVLVAVPVGAAVGGVVAFWPTIGEAMQDLGQILRGPGSAARGITPVLPIIILPPDIAECNQHAPLWVCFSNPSLVPPDPQ